MEWDKPRTALLTATKPPAESVVSVARAIDFAVAHYTTEGPTDENEFDLGRLTGEFLYYFF